MSIDILIEEFISNVFMTGIANSSDWNLQPCRRPRSWRCRPAPPPRLPPPPRSARRQTQHPGPGLRRRPK